jgi:hypothetical protein
MYLRALFVTVAKLGVARTTFLDQSYRLLDLWNISETWRIELLSQVKQGTLNQSIDGDLFDKEAVGNRDKGHNWELAPNS